MLQAGKAVRRTRLQRAHQWASEIDYWESLSTPEKRWINQFDNETYGNYWKKNGSDWQYEPRELRCELQRGSNSRRVDALTHGAISGNAFTYTDSVDSTNASEDELIAGIDARDHTLECVHE